MIDIKLHRLKLSLDYYDDVMSGAKNFEVRKNDRDYQVGDLIEFLPSERGVALPKCDDRIFLITYMLSSSQFDAIKDGYVVLGICEIREAKPEVRNNNESEEVAP